MGMILNDLKKKIQEVAYQECLKMKDKKKSYKGGKKTIVP
jgi:hypothetical protein